MTDEHSCVAVARDIAERVAAKYAADVDVNARFPIETISALRDAKLLSAGIPKAQGGMGLRTRMLGEICAAVARGCGSSAMILAMHYIQAACIYRHCGDSAWLARYIEKLVADQPLLASMTSEAGTFGDTRKSVTAIQQGSDRFALEKDATTGSYCAQTDGILVTARRDAQAFPGDQVLALVLKSDYTLKQTSGWDTLGMRGTCSPGFHLASSGDSGQILPSPFAEICARTMLPYSHILWSALWWGLAADAVSRAADSVRTQSRKAVGSLPPSALQLADAVVDLQTLRSIWTAVASEYDELGGHADDAAVLHDLQWPLKLNNLKIAASRSAPGIVHTALQILGIAGYKNDSQSSVSRHYRDLLSAELMISNERVRSNNAAMLLIFRDL